MNLETPDPYDIWNTQLGQNIKKVFYKNKILGVLPSAGLTIFDFYIYNNIRYGYDKRPYPIAHAYKALIGTELFRKTQITQYLSFARDSISWLANNYSHGFSGYCWGLNMPWVSKIAVYDENIPHVTHTPYVLEAFIDFQKLTSDNKYDNIIVSVFNFLDGDLHKMIDKNSVLALSYSPRPEKRIVINANSYAMLSYALLIDKSPLGRKYSEDKVKRLYQFLVNHQNSDGSWYYYSDKTPGNFIDCFHTCFVLKNIFKVNEIVPLSNSEKIISHGYQFLKNHLWDSKRNLFKRFSVTDRLSPVKYDLYDNAEMLNLAILLKDDMLIEKLLASIKLNFVAGDDIYSHIVYPNLKVNKNTLRWATLPYLYALSKKIKYY
ncbi:hypothetical protein RQM65_05315 [Pricia sp. S334]|uniref:Delta-aminolevulinic acid dehydratase n=1 Tax=Pricia mediterranea TaxID=3076079 RepID=A0ABU3L322_9FLAO|nr:hypothetical protein [Pricia sp. S334]MDT7828082.1 hypothetical protein [Pricia sp. S334]